MIRRTIRTIFRRAAVAGWVLTALLITCSSDTCPVDAAEASPRQPRLRAAALQFGLAPEGDLETSSMTDARARTVVGELKTTAMMLDDGATRLCLVTTHFDSTRQINVSNLFRETLADDLQLPKSHVHIFTSHNHSGVSFAKKAVHLYRSYTDGAPPVELRPLGKRFLATLRDHVKRLPELLEPVTVWWAEGQERRITYHRKGRRADGTSFFMREEDRELVGVDFNGDIDTQAPVVVLKNAAGAPIAALTQFTGHPVTAYHPENPVVFGEWPQVAGEDLARRLGEQGGVPVGFLQGCAADVNSKEMFVGGVERATEFGHMLGQAYIDALDDLRQSTRDGLDFAIETVNVPLAPLPSKETLIAELEEMEDFIQRAESGDEDTLFCVGLNFPRALTPRYRGRLVAPLRAWNLWALEQYEAGRADAVPSELEMEIIVLRLGDVGIVGLPCEPFQGIGRQIRRGSPLPLSIPCGYVNLSHGYITDSSNTGDQEYMSAHHRYTKFRPPLKKPAGDVLADQAIKTLSQFAK